MLAVEQPVVHMASWEESYITLHVVWHPRCADSGFAARQLIEHFTGKRYSIGDTGVSVFEWSDPPAGRSIPAKIDFSRGETVVVIALIGDEIQRDPTWSNYVRDLAERCCPDHATGSQRRMYPVAITERTIATELGVQALRWHDWQVDRDGRGRRLVREITYETSRMLRTMLADDESGSRTEKVGVFLSHSKHDDVGERVAQRIRNWLHDDVQLSVFLDIADIPAGLPPDKVLETEVQQSAVLIVYSDSFSSREWCRREVLVAKESDRPIVVADCIEDLDERSFPYLANVPLVRLCSQHPHGVERVVGRLLDEVFKYFLWKWRTATLSRTTPDVEFVARAPELLTAVNARTLFPNAAVIVYPDPPLSLREVNLMDGIGVNFESLSQWISEVP